MRGKTSPQNRNGHSRWGLHPVLERRFTETEPGSGVVQNTFYQNPCLSHNNNDINNNSNCFLSHRNNCSNRYRNTNFVSPLSLDNRAC